MAFDAGDVVSRMLLDMTDFRRALRSAPGVAKKDLARVEKQMAKTTGAMSKTEEAFVSGSEKRSKRFEKSWWKRFGTVAVGFTIAYRSMQVVQRGVEELVGSFTKGIKEIDEFRMSIVEVAASLQMLTEQPSTEGLKAYYAFASGVFEQLEMIAVKHISTGEDLRNAYAKLATMGIVPQTEEQLEQMARMVDLVLIQTRGLDKQRQIRTELQSFVKGEMRQGAVVARMMRERVEGYEEVIKNIKEESDVAKKTEMIFAGTAKVLDSVGSVSEAIMNTHTAWLATLQAIINRIWRAGLFMMYEDLLDVMRKIYDIMIDQNQLTETALKVAYGYQVAWKAVKMILEGIYNTSVGIYTSWVGLTGELDIITSLFKVFAADVVIIKHGFQVSAMLLDYIVTKVKEWVNFQLDPGLQKHEKELNALMEEREWIQERILAIGLKRIELELDLKKGVEGSKSKLEALHEIGVKYQAIWEKINLQVGNLNSLLEPSLFTFDDLTEKINKLNEEVLVTLTKIAELGTGLSFEKFKKALEARLTALRAHMKGVLDLTTGSLSTDETIRKKFDKAWAKTTLDKYDYAEYLAREEYKTFAKYEDLKADAALILNAKLRDVQDQRLADDVKLYKSIAQQNLQTQREFEKDLLAVLEQSPEAYAKVMGKKNATDLWYLDQKKKLDKDLADSALKVLEVQLMMTETMVDYWSGALKQMGQQSESAFDAFKRMQQLQAVIDAVRISILAVKWAYEWTGPAAPYVSVALSTALFAAMMTRVGMIERQQYSYGYAAGGWLDTHQGGGKIGEGAGGKDDVFLGATPGVLHMGMRDEYVFVMNKEAAKKYGALLESMNEETYAKGGWIARGYGIDVPNPFKAIQQAVGGVEDAISGVIGIESPSKQIEDWWKRLTEIPPPKFDPDAFAGILYSIRQMLGETTALEDMVDSTNQQFKAWVKQLEDMGASEEQLNQVRNQEAIVIAKLTADMQEDFLKPLEDIWQKGVMTDYGYELLQLGVWYEEQKKLAEDLGLSLDDLNLAYATQRQEIEDTRAAIEEGITRRLGELLEAATPGAGLTSIELALYDLTKEFVAVIEEIQGWTDETGQDFSGLIADATRVYELEMEAALAQTEVAKTLEDAINSWEDVAGSIEDALYSLQITLASPATIMERMGLVKGLIDAFPDVATPEDAAELQQLWMDYLELAQEAYQRPSSEYQAIWGQVIGALEDIRADAEDFASIYELELATATDINAILTALTGTEVGSAGAYLSDIVTAIQAGIPVSVALTTEDFTVTIPDVAVDITIPDIVIPPITIPDVSVDVTTAVTVDDELMKQQKTVLEEIRSNTYMSAASTYLLAGGAGGYAAGFFPQYAKYGGIFSGPESGYPVILHGIEEVRPLGKGESSVVLNLNLTIKESKTPRETAAEVEVRIEDFLRKGRGRKLMQEAAEGR